MTVIVKVSLLIVVVGAAGAVGTVAAVMLNSAESALKPMAFLARTLNLYVEPVVMPVDLVNDSEVTPEAAIT